ncbi:MAG: class I SAM-dependent methyltransferase [Anaerolineales bacterium]|jgi:SAM-dependent methyltransferase
MDEKTTVKAGYNTIAARYLETRSEDTEDFLLLDHLIKRLPQGARVLDAGCGAGVPITKFLCRFFDVIGVDFAVEQIRLARRLVPEAHFLCQDITSLSFSNASLDAICSFYAIIHIPRREHHGLMVNFKRMLKPGGLALLCLGADDLESQIEDDYLGARMYWSHFDAEVNLNMLKDCGFDIICDKLIDDISSPGAKHLFVVAEKQ